MTLLGIETRYHGATATRQARVSARWADGESINGVARVSVPYDYSLSPYHMHLRAADALYAAVGQTRGELEPIAIPTSRGYIFAILPDTQKESLRP
jgi:hypothetical protein